MQNREIVIDGVKYVLGKYNFGVEMDIAEQCMDVNVTGSGKNMKASPSIRTGKMQVLQIVHSLKFWEFKGINEEGNFIIDATKGTLQINEENVRTLPSKHGKMLLEIAKELNDVSEEEVKN